MSPSHVVVIEQPGYIVREADEASCCCVLLASLTLCLTGCWELFLDMLCCALCIRCCSSCVVVV